MKDITEYLLPQYQMNTVKFYSLAFFSRPHAHQIPSINLIFLQTNKYNIASLQLQIFVFSLGQSLTQIWVVQKLLSNHSQISVRVIILFTEGNVILKPKTILLFLHAPDNVLSGKELPMFKYSLAQLQDISYFK